MKNPLETLCENNEGKQKLEGLHEEVMKLGQMALEWKNRCHAMELALETERQAADRYARQVAHWIAKHDELLFQQINANTEKQLTNDECRAKFEAWYSSAPEAEPEPERTYELTDESMTELTKDCIWLGWQAAHGIGVKP